MSATAELVSMDSWVTSSRYVLCVGPQVAAVLARASRRQVMFSDDINQVRWGSSFEVTRGSDTFGDDVVGGRGGGDV